MRRLGGRGLGAPLRRAAPLVVAAVVTAAILRRYPATDIAASLRAGNALGAAPYVVLVVLSFLAWGALADHVVLRRFAPLGVLDVARGKAAAAVLTTLGYVLGNGGYGVWIARRTGMGMPRSAGLVVYIVLGDLAAVGVVASLGIPFAGSVAPVVRAVALAVALVPAFAIVAGPWVPAGRWTWLDPWRAVPRRAGLAQLALRCVNVAFYALFTTLAARAFGLAVPVAVLLALTPVLLLVKSLPVNVAGIGAAQAAWLLFFLPYEDGAKILAFDLGWTVMFGVAMIARGLPFVPRALEEIA